MFLTPRQAQIVDMAKSKGRVLVDELADIFDVTPQTIRRDLNELCTNAQLARIHGGALYPTTNENLEYEQRRLIAAGAKRAIGEATARLIPDNSSLFINIGTTTEAVAKALLEHRNLLVFTNNINVANILRECPSIEVILSGGVVRHSDGALVGETAVDFFNRFKVDIAIIGASAIDSTGSLLDFDLREVSVAQAIMSNSARTILVTDATKFDRRAPMRIADISRIDTFVTDRVPLPGFRILLTKHKVRLVETSVSETNPEIS